MHRYTSRNIFLSSEYLLGARGVDACPTGYEKIIEPQVCQLASTSLGLVYSPSDNDGNANSVCNLCGWCEVKDRVPKTLITNSHGILAKWVCQRKSSNY